MSGKTPVTDQDIVTRIGLLLRAGVIASACVLLAGGVVYLARHGREEPPDRRHFSPPEFSRPADAFRAAREGRGRAIIQLGIFLLVLTPMMRVTYTIFAFARRRDFLYVLFPAVVLLVLLAGYFFEPPRL